MLYNLKKNHKVLFILLSASYNISFANDHLLDLNQYLNQVKKSNDSFKSNLLLEKAGYIKSNEGFLSVSPKVFASTSYLSDSQPPVSKALRGSKTEYEHFSIGLAKQFTTGTNVKLEYDNSYTDITQPNPNLVIHDRFWYAKPIVSIEQPLFRNWLGKETKALITLKNSQAKINKHYKRFENKKIILDATNVYWDFATLNENIKIKQESVGRSEKLLNWTSKRTKLGLSNESDKLQAKSALLQRQYELQALLDMTKSKARLFNALRNIQSDLITENLISYKTTNIEKIKPAPTKLPASIREDLKAKYHAKIASKAQAELAQQNITPVLNLKMQYYPSGRDSQYTHTASEAWRAKHNTYSVKLDFNMPIDFELNKNLASAYKSEKNATKLAYYRAKFEVENEWMLLAEQLNLLNNQLKLANELVETQEKKLETEQDLLKNGRTTTFKVLQFEQDYLNSQVQFYNTKNRLLNLTAALELFKD